MDDADRTTSTAIEIPAELRGVLQRAADGGLERACEHDEWDDRTRDRVLEAARLRMAFRFDEASVADIAALADNAIRWTEMPSEAPTTSEALNDLYDLLSVLRELIVLRDDAQRRLWPQLATTTPEAAR
jgi:hypothetical protein